MKILVLSKTSIDQLPLTITQDSLRSGHQSLCIPLKPIAERLSVIGATDFLQRLVYGFRPDLLIVPNRAARIIKDWRKVKSGHESMLMVYLSLDEYPGVEHKVSKDFDIAIITSVEARFDYKIKTVFHPPPSPLSFIEFAQKSSVYLVSKSTPRKARFYLTNTYSHPRWKALGALNRAELLRLLSKQVSIELWGEERVYREVGQVENVSFNGFLKYREIPKVMKGAVTITTHAEPKGAGVSTHVTELLACGALQALEARKPFTDWVSGWGEMLLFEPSSIEDAVERAVSLSNLEYKEAMKIAQKSIELARRFTVDRFIQTIIKSVKA